MFGLNGRDNCDKSLEDNGVAAQGTETKAGMPYKIDSRAAMLLNATVAYTPESNAS
jgi:hypothetical protein